MAHDNEKSLNNNFIHAPKYKREREKIIHDVKSRIRLFISAVFEETLHPYFQ